MRILMLTAAAFLLIAAAPVVTATDVDCVSNAMPQADQAKIAAGLVSDIATPPEQRRGNPNANREKSIELLLPHVMKCANDNHWERERLQGVFFHFFGRLVAPVYSERARAAGIDVAGLQAWFDKQPEDVRLKLFSPELGEEASNVAIVRMATELAVQGYDTKKLLADTDLSTQLLKSMVQAARLKAGLGMFVTPQ